MNQLENNEERKYKEKFKLICVNACNFDKDDPNSIIDFSSK